MASISEETLRELYVEQGLSQQAVADELGFKSRTPVRNALDEYGIESHSQGGKSADAQWKDPETLRDLYHGENMSLREVADELGCTAMTVRDWMDKHGISRRDPTHTRQPASYRVDSDGYEAWMHGGKQVYVHRLAAVAWFGFDEVAEKDEIHHVNGVRWDNRQENIIPLTEEQHRKAHGGGKPPFPKTGTQPSDHERRKYRQSDPL